MQHKLIPTPPRSDLHIHTFCSPDSSTSPDDVCRAALQRGLDAVGISDHAESWKPWDKDSPICFQGRRYSDAGEYFRLIGEVKEKYKGRLTVLAGVEIGYLSSREDDIRAFVEAYPFDYVIGSIHDSPPINWWNPGSADLLKSRPDLRRSSSTTQRFERQPSLACSTSALTSTYMSATSRDCGPISSRMRKWRRS